MRKLLAVLLGILVLASLLVVLVFTFRNSRELHGLGEGEFHALFSGPIRADDLVHDLPLIIGAS